MRRCKKVYCMGIYSLVNCATPLCFLQSCSRRMITALGTSLPSNIHQNSVATPLLLLSHHNNPTQWGHTYILYFDIFSACACLHKRNKMQVAQPPLNCYGKAGNYISQSKSSTIYTPRCEIKSGNREELNSHTSTWKNARPEEGLNLKSECILVSAMVYLHQKWNFGLPTSVEKKTINGLCVCLRIFHLLIQVCGSLPHWCEVGAMWTIWSAK